MDKKTHDKLQKSIDQMQTSQDLMNQVIQDLCAFLGRIVDYKHKKKPMHRILVTSVDGKQYDVDALKEQANAYIIERQK